MLSPLDDYPVHQISEPMRFVGTLRPQFLRPLLLQHPRDRRGARAGRLFAVIGVGQYPNLGVADAFVSVLWNGTHQVVRASKMLGADRMDDLRRPDPGRGAPGTRAGPWSSLRAQRMGRRARRGLPRVLRSTSRGAPLRPAIRAGHLRLDPVRPGRVVGKDDSVSATASSSSRRDRWWGTSDRSWGVRPVGEAGATGDPCHRHRRWLLLDLCARSGWRTMPS